MGLSTRPSSQGRAQPGAELYELLSKFQVLLEGISSSDLPLKQIFLFPGHSLTAFQGFLAPLVATRLFREKIKHFSPKTSPCQSETL